MSKDYAEERNMSESFQKKAKEGGSVNGIIDVYLPHLLKTPSLNATLLQRGARPKLPL